MKTIRWILILVVVGGIAFALRPRNALPEVKVIAVERKNVTRTLAVTGQVEAVHHSDLSSTVSGITINRVLVDKGSHVLAGQPVVELDSRDLDAACARADAQVLQARAALMRARVQSLGSGRSEDLARQVLAESTDLRNQRDQAASNLEAAAARLVQAQQAETRTREGARQQAVRGAQAQVRQAVAQRRLTEITLKRAETLMRQGAMSKADYDTARTNLDTAIETVKAAEEQVSQLAEPRTEDVLQAEAAVREAEASVAGARLGLQNAERAYRSRTASRLSLTLAQTQREADRLSIDAAQADLAQAVAAAQQARIQASHAVLRAPVTGVVTDRKAEPGETVTAGTVLLSFAAPNDLRVHVDIDEAELHSLHLGQKAVIGPDAYPDLRLQGELTEIIPTGNSERGTVEVRVSLPPGTETDRLLPQLTVDVNLVTGAFPNALVLPRGAVLDADTQPHALRIVGGRVDSCPVAITAGGAGQVIITSGLADGDTVVADPRMLHAGDRVKPVRVKPEERP